MQSSRAAGVGIGILRRPGIGILAVLLLVSPRAAAGDAEAPSPTVEPVAIAAAQPPAPAAADWTSRVQVSGLGILAYRYELTDSALNANAFELVRAYVSASAKVSERLKIVLTLDSPLREPVVKVSGTTTTVTNAAGRYDVVLKHAFVEASNVLVKGSFFRFGMSDMPWVSLAAKQWGYHPFLNIFTDREGILPSVDFGLLAGYSHPAKWIDVHAGVTNGEGWNRAEVSKHKDAVGRLTVRPLATHALLGGFSASVYSGFGPARAGADQERRRLVASLAFEGARVSLSAEIVRTADPVAEVVAKQPSVARVGGIRATGEGFSVWAWADSSLAGFPEGTRLLVRFDRMNPEIGLIADAHRRAQLGVSHRVAPKVTVVLDGEYADYERNAGAAIAAPPPVERRVMLHTVVGF